MEHKKGVAGVLLLVGVAFLLVSIWVGYQGKKKEKYQKDIADSVIRFHILANSDREEDQSLKLQVKEEVVRYMQDKLKNAENVEQARAILNAEKKEIEEIAKDKMKQEGYDYSAYAEMTNCYFPIKEYGDLTFPAGEYEALRVVIGEGEGHNWWCVMFPSLCFVDSTYQVVPDSSKEKLKRSLTEEEYNSLLDGGEGIEYGSFLYDWFHG